MLRYRLLSETGEDLGPFVASVPTWDAGDVIPRGMAGSLEVVRLVEAESGEQFDGYLVVRPMAKV